MDAQRLLQIFEQLDEALTVNTHLDIRGGAAALALGLTGRITIDIDVLPNSRFIEADLNRACHSIGIGFNPQNKDIGEQDYLEVVPEETLVLPIPSEDVPYNTVFRGRHLTVRTPPAADLVVGKLKRIEPEDLTDIEFLIARFDLKEGDIKESYSRLPRRFREDLVVKDNLRYILEDFF